MVIVYKEMYFVYHNILEKEEERHFCMSAWSDNQAQERISYLNYDKADDEILS
ncbi:MAG: hypothetical protein HUJ74_00070 [Lachnospiraceae bacterium]|nr:hypothetical protein [Lachnospiraceae bacterium]